MVHSIGNADVRFLKCCSPKNRQSLSVVGALKSTRLNMHYSINQGALDIVKEILDRKDELLCGVEEAKSGATLIDAGIQCRGTSELGRLIAETCLGGLGAVRLTGMFVGELNLPAVIVGVDQPKIAALGSQHAGWSIRVGRYHVMASGPARAMAGVEKELFDAIAYQDTSKKSVIILETRKMPTEDVEEYIADKCGISPSSLYCIIIPAASIATSV
jgi:methenyltetrahydromethanopterin cyclohydrolase